MMYTRGLIAFPYTYSSSSESWKDEKTGREFNLRDDVKTKSCMNQRLHYSRARVRSEHNGAFDCMSAKEKHTQKINER